MNKEFLNRVVGHIVKETRMDYVQKLITPPFFSTSFLPFLFFHFSYSSFTLHCKEIYSLNEQEIRYVYEEYRNTIKDKINEQEVSK
jgi:hypothetical protein